MCCIVTFIRIENVNMNDESQYCTCVFFNSLPLVFIPQHLIFAFTCNLHRTVYDRCMGMYFHSDCKRRAGNSERSKCSSTNNNHEKHGGKTEKPTFLERKTTTGILIILYFSIYSHKKFWSNWDILKIVCTSVLWMLSFKGKLSWFSACQFVPTWCKPTKSCGQLAKLCL